MNLTDKISGWARNSVVGIGLVWLIFAALHTAAAQTPPTTFLPPPPRIACTAGTTYPFFSPLPLNDQSSTLITVRVDDFLVGYAVTRENRISRIWLKGPDLTTIAVPSCYAIPLGFLPEGDNEVFIGLGGLPIPLSIQSSVVPLTTLSDLMLIAAIAFLGGIGVCFGKKNGLLSLTVLGFTPPYFS